MVCIGATATIKGADGLDHNYIVNTKFVGAPIYAKYNTFNGEFGAFSLKAGLIPMSLQEQLTAKQFVSVPSMVTLGVVGFDGTAYVGNRMAVMFIVDYFNRFAKADDGVQNEGLRMGVGVSRDL